MKAADDHFQLYEKIYFFEAERKEKLIVRLNLPLAMLVALLSFLSYLLGKAPPSSETTGLFFWVLYLYSCMCVAMGIWHFAKAWRLRVNDLSIPTLFKLEEHRKKLISYYGDGGEETANSLFIQTIADYYVMGGTTNSENNDRRVEELDHLSKFVIWAIVFSILSFIPFFLFNHP
ncbi:hypothetical protein [Pseudomonas marincola]|uniref:hypothetical protein n=1 Tax=Pseudomonas marincola TaxID=437900 RepID=UPI0008E9574F|nr:hypothetical protein [Pseudomonas marincola]SFU11612.1 hypothetical protein SAMN05216264_112113 [Pseudomonas marincola]